MPRQGTGCSFVTAVKGYTSREHVVLDVCTGTLEVLSLPSTLPPGAATSFGDSLSPLNVTFSFAGGILVSLFMMSLMTYVRELTSSWGRQRFLGLGLVGVSVTFRILRLFLRWCCARFSSRYRSLVQCFTGGSRVLLLEERGLLWSDL